MTHVEVLHPAPMKLTPHRARSERTVLSAERVPATLREAHPDAFEPFPWVSERHRIPLLRHDGVFWSPIHHYAEGHMPVRRDEFVAALAGAGDLAPVLYAAFRGTPLMAWGNLDNTGYLHEKVVGRRGEPVELDKARSVAEDGRARAAAAVRRHLDADYRLVGDAVLRRRSILVERTYHGHPAVPDRALDPSHRIIGSFHVVASPTTYAAMQAYAPAPQHERVPDPLLDRWLAAGFGDAFHGDEHRAALNSLPALVRRALSYEITVNALARESDVAHEAYAAMLDLEVEGLTGVCGLEDPALAFESISRAVGTLKALGTRSAGITACGGIARLVTDFYIPTLPVRRIDAEDEAALGIMVP